MLVPDIIVRVATFAAALFFGALIGLPQLISSRAIAQQPNNTPPCTQPLEKRLLDEIVIFEGDFPEAPLTIIPGKKRQLRATTFPEQNMGDYEACVEWSVTKAPYISI